MSDDVRLSSAAKRHNRRHKLGDRANWRCQYCGVVVQCVVCHPDTEQVATYDHFIPRARGGGRLGEGNLVTACLKCNGEKKDRMPDQRFRKVRR